MKLAQNIAGWERANKTCNQFSLSRQDGVRAEFVITSDGFLLYCSEAEGPILTCIAYFLMLYHWGNLRMD